MTTRIYINNETSNEFVLYDTDNNHFANIVASKMHSLKLNVSQSFNKVYELKFADFTANPVLLNPARFIQFTININGKISNINVPVLEQPFYIVTYGPRIPYVADGYPSNYQNQITIRHRHPVCHLP
jgi:hypothetical protein